MNKYFEYFQPTIIRASFDEELPENIRGRFFVNFNVFGIDYFNINYLLSESANGTPYLLLKEDKWGFMLEDSSNNSEVLDIPRLYIDITDEFVNDTIGVFLSFVTQSIMQNSIWGVGIDSFLCGKQYYMNYTLYNYLANTNQLETVDFNKRLPNYIDNTCQITKYWQSLDGEIYKDYKNLGYFNEKNKLLTNTYSEDELNNFYSNFCQIILDNTSITEECKSSNNNPIYDIVLNYYANFKNDEASNAINLVLNSLYANSTSSTCGCNSAINETNYNTTSCYTLYNQAMAEYLQTMLGDANFYNDWFNIWMSEDNYIPNDVLLEKLTVFINEFVSVQNALTFAVSGISNNCNCPVVSYDENNCNYQIISNYLKVLDYIKNDIITINTNKIKIYGKQFAELLPNLQF